MFKKIKYFFSALGEGSIKTARENKLMRLEKKIDKLERKLIEVQDPAIKDYLKSMDLGVLLLDRLDEIGPRHKKAAKYVADTSLLLQVLANTMPATLPIEVAEEAEKIQKRLADRVEVLMQSPRLDATKVSELLKKRLQRLEKKEKKESNNETAAVPA